MVTNANVCAQAVGWGFNSYVGCAAACDHGGRGGRHTVPAA